MRKMLKSTPSATSNIKLSSGRLGSVPAKLNTASKATEAMPSVAATEATTVPMSRSGATSARRRTMRMTSTATRTIGMMSRLSRACSVRRSCSTAVGPPTSVDGPPARRAASRMLRTPAKPASP